MLKTIRSRGFTAIAAAVTASLVEAFLLIHARESVYRLDLAVAGIAIFMLLWFWMTTWWLLHLAATASRTRSGFLPRVARVFLVVIVQIAAVLWVISWGVYLRTGRFATTDSFVYSLGQYRKMVFGYLGRSEPLSVVLFALAAVVACAAVPFLLRALSRPVEDRSGEPRFRGLAIWIPLTIGLALSILTIAEDPIDLRRIPRLEALKSRVNPAFTIVSSVFDSLREEPIRATIRDSELEPLRESGVPPAGKLPSRAVSVFFLKIESMRADSLNEVVEGRAVTPYLNALAAEGLTFTHTYAPSTHSDYSDVSTLSSLFPLRTPRHHYYSTGDPWAKTLIFDVLKPSGYTTAVFAAENLAWGHVDRFLQSPRLDVLFDAERHSSASRVRAADSGIAEAVRLGALSGGFLLDSETTNAALDWLARSIHAGSPFCLWLDLQSSHFPYELPPGAERLFEPSLIDFDVSFLHYPYKKRPVLKNAYRNGLHEADRQLGRVVDLLRRTGRLETTIIAVYGDHGEAFGEGDHVTHGGKAIESVARVPLVIRGPGIPHARSEDYPASLIDLTPTVLEHMGYEPRPDFQGIDLLSNDRTPPDERLVFLHVESPLAREDVVVLGGRWKYALDRSTGREELFDLGTDPTEAKDLATADPRRSSVLRAILAEWRRRQLAYYRFPLYYTRFYPPAAPLYSPRSQEQRPHQTAVSGKK